MKTTASVFLTTAITLLSPLKASAAIEIFGELKETKEAKDSADQGGGDAAPVKKAPPAAPTGGGMGPRTVTQNKALNILVRNASKLPEGDITVRYWFIGRDMKTKKITLVDGGEKKVSLKPNGEELIVSEPVKSKFTQRSNYVQIGKAPTAGAKPAAGAAKPQESDGIKLSSYAIQAIKNNKVVAENIMEPSFKTLIGSEGNKPGPLFQAKTEGEGDK